ncbi:anaerobic glycerol-3-phosphate dehydrogenase subunit B [Klebsiella pneumoniae]|uniref:Anaerobic glycerol-3-phosphate dehydrogenase subunit B n=1 Tax=Klebsiella pneumoniae TaxID=573 RepID=A0A377VAN8_KLEPN|nr:anaerobic glycerol-3-phosphate dehydrogenase subunit B [Klebsiella pneumoniae]
MKFDCAIIGGGLAGLLCGLALNQHGLRSVIISRGQSALHFSSASLDLLSALPNGDHVTDVAQGLQQLAEQLPEHPYSRLGAEAVLEYATQTEALLAACGAVMQGDARRPHRRVTPLGTLRPAWLSPLEVPVAPLPSQGACLVGSAALLIFSRISPPPRSVNTELPPRRWKSSYRCWMCCVTTRPSFAPPISPASWMMRICGRPCMQRCYRCAAV